MTAPQRLTLAFFADSSADALAAAKAWIAAEPRLRLRTVCRVSLDPANPRRWIVELAVSEKEPTA